LPLVEEKLGDSHPRRVMYFPNNGTALVKRLPSRYAASVANREMHYLDKLVRETMP
jgi:chemotaxis receptor (MCP) glutamine deamidase CheD